MGMKEFKLLKRNLKSVSKIRTKGIPPLEKKLNGLNNLLEGKVKERNIATRIWTNAKKIADSRWDESKIVNEEILLEELTLQLDKLNNEIEKEKEALSKLILKEVDLKPLRKKALELQSKLQSRDPDGIFKTFFHLLIIGFFTSSIFAAFVDFAATLCLVYIVIIILYSALGTKGRTQRMLDVNNMEVIRLRGKNFDLKEPIMNNFNKLRIKRSDLKSDQDVMTDVMTAEKERSEKQKSVDDCRKRMADVQKQIDEFVRERNQLMSAIAHMIPFVNLLPDDSMESLTGS